MCLGDLPALLSNLPALLGDLQKFLSKFQPFLSRLLLDGDGPVFGRDARGAFSFNHVVRPKPQPPATIAP